jgi:outer membrane lipoprotein-sorting protein
MKSRRPAEWMHRAGLMAAGLIGALMIGAGSGDLSGEQILRNIETARAAVKDYTVLIDIVADVERVKVPPMKAKMYFKYPDKVHFDSKGFALLPKEGLALNPENLIRLYSVGRVSRDTLDGVPEYTLDLRANSEKTRIQRMTVSANPARWTIDRVQIRRGWDRLMTMEFRYDRVETHWLSSEVIASFSMAQDSTESGSVDPSTPMRPPQTPRTGKIVMRFSEYQVNTGLSDSLFVSGAN